MLYDPERAWHIWTLLEATEWRWPPDVLERQDDGLMHDLMQIAFASGRVREMKRGQDA